MSEDREETLSLDPEHVHNYPLNSKTRVFAEFEKLIDYAYKNIHHVDCFIIYMHGRYIGQLSQSDVLNLTQIKCVTFYFGSIEDVRQAEQQYEKMSYIFKFCLESEVTNRVANIHYSDILNLPVPLNKSLLNSYLKEQRLVAQKKLEKLPAESSFVVPKTSVGFNARNLSIIPVIYHCVTCRYILQNPVQLTECGHRLCQSCIENWKGNTITCPECCEETPKNEVLFDLAFKSEMDELHIICSFCEWNGSLKNYQHHLDQCHQNPICNYCSKQFASRNDFNVHKQNECRLITEPCALKEYGCSDPVIRDEMSSHFKTSEHQIALLNAIRSLALISSPEGHKAVNDDTGVQLQELLETTGFMLGGIRTLNEDNRRLHDESVKVQNALQNFMSDLATIILSIQEQKDVLAGLKANQEILEQENASMKQKMNDTQCASYDSTLTWRVDHVAERMADAQSERQTSIDSPPFCSSSYGYKMRARLYLDGDGNARRTHMSLFFVLMRGEYDAILKWPFNFKVTFCLYDQTSSQRHIIDSFRPDIKSNSFQRPRSDMNIASGIPKFCPLSIIELKNNPYVRNDRMFIKLTVDFGNTPHAMLRDVLNINPGLPTHVSNELILKMVDEYRQHRLTSRSQAMHDSHLIAQSILHF